MANVLSGGVVKRKQQNAMFVPGGSKDSHLSELADMGKIWEASW